ncbi:MAG: flagellar hook-associated protein FlgK [Gammaproteobacteria bacterium]|nr:flagellar hook-associated protein FlgK [Gammaproteobacteria bacterium]
MPIGDTLGVSVSGLIAAQRALATASHNIANVNTEGYSRQRVALGTNTPQFSGNGYIGSGVQVSGITRIYDAFLIQQVRTNTSANSQLQIYYNMASQVDNLLADNKAGLAPALQEFFNAVQGVANNPASIPSRQVMLSSATALTDRFHYFDRRLSDLNNGINSQLATAVAEINSLAAGIAKLNSSITTAQGANNGQLPNDLLDQRDILIAKLATQVAVTTVTQDDGAVNVFIGSGQSLVLGAQANTLSTSTNAFDSSRKEVTITVGSIATTITDNLIGGITGGLLDFRRTVLDSAQNALGRVADGLAITFNAQHGAGQDLNGVLGANFFTSGTAQVLARTGSSPNTGTGVVNASITSIGALTTSDYLLQNTGGSYTLTRLSDNTTTTLAGFPGTPATVDGVTISLGAGTINTGDSFLIRPTRNGAANIGVAISDTRKIAAAAPIRTSATLANTGAGTISSGTVVNAADTNLQQLVTITFTSATTYDVTGPGTGNPTGLAYTPGANISYNGWQIQLNGTPAAGDTFSVEPNTSGVADNRNALLLVGLQTQNTLAAGTATYQADYGQLVADVGSKTHQADINRKAQEALLNQIIQTREAVSGVNLDEEAADLIRYQQAYQAAARVIGTTNELFDTLLATLRR